jgi:hypothetical protein
MTSPQCWSPEVQQLMRKEKLYVHDRTLTTQGRQIEDMKRDLLRSQEDKSYQTILAARACVDDHIMTIRAREDKNFKHIEELLQEEEHVSGFKPLVTKRSQH